MEFIEIRFVLDTEFSEILVAELGEVGFESFIDTEVGLNAYIQTDLYEEKNLHEIAENYKETFTFSFETIIVPKMNWNEEWEKNYPPIIVAEKCIVKASFHQIEQQYPYEITINPKMSFGTGHHETTALMLENQLSVNHQDKSIVDVGCGTGILAIMAYKLGAKSAVAFDIEEWAVENTKENFTLNNCPINNNLNNDLNNDLSHIFMGTIQDINPKSSFDIVLANINRNVLLAEIPVYTQLLAENGFLLVSGFYEQDMEDISKVASSVGLQKISYKVKNNWTSIVFQKNK